MQAVLFFGGNEANYFFGNINAQGGLIAGDGGFVEVSCPKALDVRGLINAGAINGITGKILFDPSVSLTISSAADAGVTFTAPNYTFSTATPNIDVASLATNLGTSNVGIDSSTGTGGTGSIIISDSFTWATANTLTISSPTSIHIGSSTPSDPIVVISSTFAGAKFYCR